MLAKYGAVSVPKLEQVGRRRCNRARCGPAPGTGLPGDLPDGLPRGPSMDPSTHASLLHQVFSTSAGPGLAQALAGAAAELLPAAAAHLVCQLAAELPPAATDVTPSGDCVLVMLAPGLLPLMGEPAWFSPRGLIGTGCFSHVLACPRPHLALRHRLPWRAYQLPTLASPACLLLLPAPIPALVSKPALTRPPLHSLPSSTLQAHPALSCPIWPCKRRKHPACVLGQP